MRGRVLTVVASWLLLAAGVCHPQVPTDPTLTKPDGDSILWSEWTRDHGAAAVVMWGSWMPDSDSVLSALPGIQSVARERGLGFVVIALQETREASAKVIGNKGLPWLHDRHGALLKAFRVYDIPAMIVVSEQGSVLAKVEVSPQALRLWEGP